MRGIQKALLVMITVLFFVISCLLQFSLGLEILINSPQYYRSVAAGIKPDLVSTITLSLTAERSPLLRPAVAGAVSGVFSEEWLSAQTNNVLLAGDSAAVIDLSERKAVLEEALTKTLRRRSPRELALMGLSHAMVKPAVQEMIGRLELPDKVTLAGLFTLDQPASLQKITKLRLYRSRLLYISIPGFILLALSLVFASGPQKCFRWIGGGILAAGLTFLPGLLVFNDLHNIIYWFSKILNSGWCRV